MTQELAANKDRIFLQFGLGKSVEKNNSIFTILADNRLRPGGYTLSKLLTVVRFPEKIHIVAPMGAE